MTIVTCNGCFDGLHHGHLFFLGYCLAQGNKLIVGINSDEYIFHHKRKNPIPQQKRISDLMELGFVDCVQVFSDENPISFIRSVKPDIHCISEEYKGVAIEEQICRELGIKVVYVPRVGKWSSTSIRGGL